MKRFRIIGSTAIVSLALAGCVATGPAVVAMSLSSIVRHPVSTVPG